LARRSTHLLAALFSAATLAAAPAAATGAGDCTPAATWPVNRADVAAQVVALVNAHRVALGLEPLVVSPTLSAAATWKAQNMAAYRYMDHDDAQPQARTADERLAACGYPQAATWGENIASGYATAQAVVDAWLGSPGHRANIERPEFRATGVGAAGAPAYWSQTFGAVVDAGSVVPAPVAPASAPASPAAAGPSATAPSAAVHAASSSRPIRVSCAQHGRSVACSVRGQRGALVRIALMRSGRTFARVRMRASSDAVRVALHPMRRLRAGRYALVVRAGPAASERERRITLVVR
jgi:uncharacterized protein YkwD